MSYGAGSVEPLGGVSPMRCLFFDARLADSNRVHAVLGTLASLGTCISLRVPAPELFARGLCRPGPSDPPERRNCWHA
jgi:hypothetical protein